MEPCTSVQQLSERLKLVWANKCSVGYGETSGIWHAETGIEVCFIAW